ncbi:unnamed protein product [Paramecium primaurelia]|uniref:Transcriptional coactivator p15 (PC4) C-terminal domain-containing protein n=1 Tax=Paramecium primaurelia TaxID=5886 RepID=A0A8S1K067_PARPR|nr:unnamed protein product [Paramecium primaurelia]
MKQMRDRSSSEEYDKIFDGKKQSPVQDKKGKKQSYTFEDGQYFFDLTTYKKIAISKFKGNTMISLREYFDKDGQMLPTKKGITLSLDNWEKFKQYIGEIDECINKLKK